MSRAHAAARCVARKAESEAAPRDFYPTPPWVSRWFGNRFLERGDWVWECACGDGAMSRALAEFASAVFSSDIADYGFEDAAVIDFLERKRLPLATDWIVSNPPFSRAEEFCRHALAMQKKNRDLNVAFLARVQFVEGKARHSLFAAHPPLICFHSGRINFWKGTLRPECKSAHAHAWFVWHAQASPRRDDKGGVEWISPTAKADWTRPGDYDDKGKGEILPLVA